MSLGFLWRAAIEQVDGLRSVGESEKGKTTLVARSTPSHLLLGLGTLGSVQCSKSVPMDESDFIGWNNKNALFLLLTTVPMTGVVLFVDRKRIK